MSVNLTCLLYSNGIYYSIPAIASLQKCGCFREIESCYLKTNKHGKTAVKLKWLHGTRDAFTELLRPRMLIKYTIHVFKNKQTHLPLAQEDW